MPLTGQNRSDCFQLKVHAGDNQRFIRIFLQLDIQISFTAQRYFKAKQANYFLKCIDWIAVPFVRLAIKKKRKLSIRGEFVDHKYDLFLFFYVRISKLMANYLQNSFDWVDVPSDSLPCVKIQEKTVQLGWKISPQLQTRILFAMDRFFLFKMKKFCQFFLLELTFQTNAPFVCYQTFKQ